jgi:hypothetical protein
VAEGFNMGMFCAASQVSVVHKGCWKMTGPAQSVKHPSARGRWEGQSHRTTRLHISCSLGLTSQRWAC